MELDERKVRILKAIVSNYLETGEPVGSRTISKLADMNVSPATIRNEMSDLEDMGYICQPHASAGRVPTDAGYRFYVDSIMADRDEAFCPTYISTPLNMLWSLFSIIQIYECTCQMITCIFLYIAMAFIASDIVKLMRRTSSSIFFGVTNISAISSSRRLHAIWYLCFSVNSLMILRP